MVTVHKDRVSTSPNVIKPVSYSIFSEWITAAIKIVTNLCSSHKLLEVFIGTSYGCLRQCCGMMFHLIHHISGLKRKRVIINVIRYLGVGTNQSGKDSNRLYIFLPFFYVLLKYVHIPAIGFHRTQWLREDGEYLDIT